MGEAPNMYPNLNDQQQFRLNKINKVKDYFIAVKSLVSILLLLVILIRL